MGRSHECPIVGGGLSRLRRAERRRLAQHRSLVEPLAASLGGRNGMSTTRAAAAEGDTAGLVDGTMVMAGSRHREAIGRALSSARVGLGSRQGITANRFRQCSGGRAGDGVDDNKRAVEATSGSGQLDTLVGNAAFRQLPSSLISRINRRAFDSYSR
jgi:hypothetical protein